METIKVKPWGDGQGDHVMINADDFDSEKHQLFEDAQVIDSFESGEPARRGRRKAAEE